MQDRSSEAGKKAWMTALQEMLHRALILPFLIYQLSVEHGVNDLGISTRGKFLTRRTFADASHRVVDEGKSRRCRTSTPLEMMMLVRKGYKQEGVDM